MLDTLGGPPRPNLNDMAATQKAYVDYLARARGVADKALSDVTAAGAPPVPVGERAAEQVRADLTRLRDNVGDAQLRLAQLNPSDAGSVAAAFAAANNVVGSLGSGAQTMATLESEPALRAAVAETQECQRFLPGNNVPGAPAPN